jgi:hypothetical protein
VRAPRARLPRATHTRNGNRGTAGYTGLMTSMEKLLTEALALPEDERARLAHELLLSLDQERTG